MVRKVALNVGTGVMKTLKTIFAVCIDLLVKVGAASAQSFAASKTQDNFAVKYFGVVDGYLCFQLETTGINENYGVLKIYSFHFKKTFFI
jgi:hypothetical protein